MDAGVLYVATGDQFVREARVSAESVREQMGDIPIAIATDVDRGLDTFETVIPIDSPVYGFGDKIRGMQQSPFEKTLYLDTDIYVCSSLDDLFELLSNFDMAAVPNQNRDHYSGTSLGVPQAFPEHNTGVLPYNQNVPDTFFEQWAENNTDEGWADQPAFRKTVYESDIEFVSLPQEYNYQPHRPAHISKDLKVAHGRLLDIETVGAPKQVDITRIAEKVNEQNGHRLYVSGCYQVGEPLSIPQRIERSLSERGAIGTVRATLRLGIQKLT